MEMETIAMMRSTERCFCDEIIDKKSVDYAIKAAALRVSPSVVSVITHDIPDDMIVEQREQVGRGKYVCPGSGIIIQSEDTWDEDGGASYSSTVLCPAHLFKRTNSIQPHQIEVEVRVSGSKLYKAELLACDFHFNIAALRIKSDTPLRPATLRHLSDLPSLDDRGILQRGCTVHSFNVQSGTKILIAKRSWWGHFEILVYKGVLRKIIREELLSAILESFLGSCIRILLSYQATLFQGGGVIIKAREICRPWVGVDIANLVEAPLRFLVPFKRKFSDIGSGVIVTEVEKDTPAYCSGIRLEDVIIECDGKRVQSKIEFFESMWDYVGNSVELAILRASDGQRFSLCMLIKETTPTNFYSWELPYVSETEVDKLSGDGAS